MKVYEVTIKAVFVTDDEMANPSNWSEDAILSELSLCHHVDVDVCEMVAGEQSAKVAA